MLYIRNTCIFIVIRIAVRNNVGRKKLMKAKYVSCLSAWRGPCPRLKYATPIQAELAVAKVFVPLPVVNGNNCSISCMHTIHQEFHYIL